MLFCNDGFELCLKHEYTSIWYILYFHYSYRLSNLNELLKDKDVISMKMNEFVKQELKQIIRDHNHSIELSNDLRFLVVHV